MATTAIERLYRLSVDGAPAIAQLNKIADATKNTDKQLSDFNKSFSDFKKNVLAGLSVAAVVAGFKHIVESMSEIVDTSAKLGITTDELQKLRFAASQVGVDSGTLSIGIKKLSIAITQVDDASSEAGKQLRSLGVTSGDTVSSALGKVADRFQKASDGANKTAVAVKAFGKAGNEFVPLLNDGSKALKDFADEAVRLGLIVDGKTLGLFDQFGDQADKLQKVLGSVGIQIAGGMLPALTSLVDALVESVNAGSTFKDIGQGIGEVVIFFATVFLKASATVTQFASGLGAVVASLAAFFNGLSDGLDALIEFASGNRKAAADFASSAASNFRQAATVIKEWADDTNKAEKSVNDRIIQLTESFEKYKRDGIVPTKKGHEDLSAAAAANAKVVAELTFQYITLTKFLNETDKLYLKIRLGLVIYTKSQLDLAIAIAKRKDEVETNKNIQKSYKDLFDAQEKQIEQLDKLIATIDPANKKTEEYAEGLTILTNAYQTGNLSAEELDKRVRQLNDAYSGEIERLKALAEAYGDILQQQDKEVDQYNKLLESLDPVVKKNDEYAAGLEIISNAYLRGRITAEEMDAAVKKLNDRFKEQDPVLKVVQDNFESFFKNLESGTADIEDAFKRMVQSILAQLLKLLAQKAILAAFGIDISPPVRAAAHGMVFDQSGIVRRYAQGGVLHSPVLFPLAGGLGQAGEAGSEGVFPLARTSSGDLGVKGVSANVQVNVVNNTSADVEVKASDDGQRIDIIIERTKRALANDVRTGGNMFSSSIESTYALGRARG